MSSSLPEPWIERGDSGEPRRGEDAGENEREEEHTISSYGDLDESAQISSPVSELPYPLTVSSRGPIATTPTSRRTSVRGISSADLSPGSPSSPSRLRMQKPPRATQARSPSQTLKLKLRGRDMTLNLEEEASPQIRSIFQRTSPPETSGSLRDSGQNVDYMVRIHLDTQYIASGELTSSSASQPPRVFFAPKSPISPTTDFRTTVEEAQERRDALSPPDAPRIRPTVFNDGAKPTEDVGLPPSLSRRTSPPGGAP
ncbi:hypothetical protein PUNSTDRAFT_130147 [Punctularia strigosozonata HHB-11173 SS5]|uniref:uncharacterized protein n=1 Tax=Punctularia strigosozonata (strain HHB-11173) TaxID=741275 RepID=UPI0004417229|nr:uncharacterized protein PUNSTDRAFT_130147 [Punctularia strigosozonata HHB-11173 SS5]EIN14521.1 hypothetical protein PUNSTDRAFT_130147 [Punctularia strigosozonata HHB-11173 SS5]